jgi:hypothetical protein
MPPFFLRPAEGELVSIAEVYSSPPEYYARSAFLGLGGGKVAAEIAEVLHLFRQDIGQFLGQVGTLLTGAAVHETRPFL